jgi:hypothetical protein
MEINLNDRFVFGLEIQEKNGLAFYSMGATESKEKFLSFSQYLLDSFSGPDKIVVIHTGSQNVIDFDGFMKAIGLKKQRGAHAGLH